MKNVKILSLLAFASILVACGGTPSTSQTTTSSSSSSSSMSSSSSSSSSSSVANYKTNKDFEKAKTTYTKDGVTYDLNMHDIYKNGGVSRLNPLEDQKILVIPFGFPDSTLQSVQNQNNINRIKTAFFGTQEEIDAVDGTISIADYYRTSSYGKANFEGEVANNWCIYSGSAASLDGNSTAAASYARNWYDSEYKKENHGLLGEDAKPLTYFDADSDGHIDLLWIVYSHPTDHNNQTWWAHVTQMGNAPSVGSPTVSTLGWASIDWFGGSSGYDTTTFIHETGHAFGLDDYYDYNKNWHPFGGVDMMDQNVGDHCAFSKFSLGWLSPLVVEEASRITLRPTATSGDCFIIPAPNYNGTAFDEYFMIEFIAPVGNAEEDYKKGDGFMKPGIRISHVDARLYINDHDTYLADNPQDGKDFRLDNSKGRSSYKSDYFVDADGNKSYMALNSIIESSFSDSLNTTNSSTFMASDASLFTKNQSFDLTDSFKYANVFMPSKSNLWNKAKTITGWKGQVQQYEIDEECTFDYRIRVREIKETQDEFGYQAVVEVIEL